MNLDLLNLFRQTFSALFMIPAGDPRPLLMAKAFREASSPLLSMLEYGEGRVSFAYVDGRLVMEARTPRYDVTERIDY